MASNLPDLRHTPVSVVIPALVFLIPIHYGALGVVPGPADPPLEDLAADVADRVETLAELSEQPGRWVLGLPRYDEPWTAPGTRCSARRTG